MAVAEDIADEVPKKPSRLPLILGVVLAAAFGGGGFYLVQSGKILGSSGTYAEQDKGTDDADPLPEVAFVPIDPLVINLGKGGTGRHLKFRAQLEVDPSYQADVAVLLPRVLDVLNGYLRAVDIADLEEPTALIRLRAQMLRRVQMVTGEGRVRDLLIMEFVLN